MIKKFRLVALVLWLLTPCFTLAQTQIDIPSADKTECRIIRQWDTGLVMINTISTLALLDSESKQGDFISLGIPGYVKAGGEFGTPQFPSLSMLVEIPQKATVSVQLDAMEEETISLNDFAPGRVIVPCQPPRSKNVSAKERPFHFSGDVYSDDAFIEPVKVSVEILGTMRSTRIARVSLCPFTYNPVTNQLVVTKTMTVTLSFDSADLALTRQIKKRYGNPHFNSTLGRIKNRIPASQNKDAIIYDTMAYPLTYVVVASNAYLQNAMLQEFITWKSLTGYHVIQADTDEIYSNPSTDTEKRTKLKRYLQVLYNEEETPPSYVLFVGDVDQIPPYLITGVSIAGDTDFDDHVTDLTYCEYTGDYIPDAYYGRMPVQDDGELTAVMTKTLKYETYDPVLNATHYLDSCLMMAGADADLAPVHGNGQVAYLINEYFNTDSAYTSIFAYLYGVSWTWDGATTVTTGTDLVTTSLMDTIESGVGFVNYNGHCGTEGWWNGDAYDMELDTGDISDLNPSPYGFYVANCCESSRFELDRTECIGKEMFLSEDKGAVAYVGAANYSFWDEDFFWAVGYTDLLSLYANYLEEDVQNLSFDDTGRGNFDDLWHDIDNDVDYETPEYWYTTAAQMIYSGNLSVMENSEYNDAKPYYWQIYNVQGDPSLMPYLADPVPIPDPVYDAPTPCTDTSMTVGTEPYTMVALSGKDFADTDYVLFDSALADETGAAQLSFAQLEDQINMYLVITGQNLQPKKIPFNSNAFPSGLSPTVSFYIGSNPAATEVEVFYGRAFSLINNSTGCPTGYLWDFEGDPTISLNTAARPTVTYYEVNDFDVTLNVTNLNGTVPLTKTNYIHVSPYVNFTVNDTTIESGNTVTFTDQTQPSSFATSWAWTFQGGTPSSSSQRNPQVVYHTAGVYNVTLSVSAGGNTYPLSGPTTKSAYIKVDYAIPDYAPAMPTDGGGGCFIGTACGSGNIPCE